MSGSDDSPGQDPAARRLELAAKAITLIYALANLAAVAWFLIPEHQRRAAIMRAMASIREHAGQAACRTGRQAMGLEISGRAANYEIPYRLSLIRDRAARAYDRLRYTA